MRYAKNDFSKNRFLFFQDRATTVIPESRRDIRDPGAKSFKRLLYAGAGKNLPPAIKIPIFSRMGIEDADSGSKGRNDS
jgi:hypothetical protein